MKAVALKSPFIKAGKLFHMTGSSIGLFSLSIRLRPINFERLVLNLGFLFQSLLGLVVLSG